MRALELEQYQVRKLMTGLYLSFNLMVFALTWLGTSLPYTKIQEKIRRNMPKAQAILRIKLLL
jgi:hypothetical protein